MKYHSMWEAWYLYEVQFTGIDEAEFCRLLNDVDRRDVSLVLDRLDGSSCRFVDAAQINYSSEDKLLSLKDYGVRRPRRRSLWDRVLGRPAVPPEREQQWHGVSKRSVARRLSASDPIELVQTLWAAAGGTARRHAPWAAGVLVRFATHEDPFVRDVAIDGCGELARLHGYTDTEIQRVVERAHSDPDESVRKAAASSADEIRRFADGGAKQPGQG